MNALLLAMPEQPFDLTLGGFYFPNLAICSLAGQLHRHAVRCVDLQRFRDPVSTLKQCLAELRPQVVGISANTFQFSTALRYATLIRNEMPSCRIVLGGYHVSLAPVPVLRALIGSPVDFVVEGEAETSFTTLVEALSGGDADDANDIPGVAYRRDGIFVRVPRRELLDLDSVRLPARHKRLVNDFRFSGKRVDVIETSRGCTMGCGFCSVHGMYGRAHRAYSIDRVVEDALVMKSQGVQRMLFVDDNVTNDVARFKRLCERFAAERLRMEWDTQATVSAIAHDEELVRLMAAGGCRQVSLGIESTDEEALRFLRKRGGESVAREAVARLRRHGILATGLFMLGTPSQDEEAIARFEDQAAALGLDFAYVGFVVPYPGTATAEELDREGLIVNRDDFSRYTPEHANIRTRHLSADRLKELRRRFIMRLLLDPRGQTSRNFYKQLLRTKRLRNARNLVKEVVRRVLPAVRA